MCTLHMYNTLGMADKSVLSNTYHQTVINTERVSCGFGDLTLRCCALTFLQSENKNCVLRQKFSLKYILELLKISEIYDIKDQQKK